MMYSKSGSLHESMFFVPGLLFGEALVWADKIPHRCLLDKDLLYGAAMTVACGMRFSNV